jgi:chemotaxis signal transduction protein
VPSGPVDFDDLHRQLDRVEARLSQASGPVDRRQALMFERARALAAPAPSAPDDLLPLLLFTIGGVRHAVEVEAVVQVVEARGLQRLVATPPWLLGALLARGRVVPVLDVRERLGLGRGLADLGKVLVLEQAGELVGLAVEALDGRHDVARCTLSPGASPIRWRAADGLAVIDPGALVAPRGGG